MEREELLLSPRLMGELIISPGAYRGSRRVALLAGVGAVASLR